jgi:adenylate cyclase
LHALVQRRETGEFSLVDLGSRNGSFVNGERVSLPVVLGDRDRLLFGDQELVFHNRTRTPSSSPSPGTDTRNQPTTAIHTHSLATIMVVDIRDFTLLARTVSQALLSQAIGTWFLRVGQITQRFGSWGQRYIGDAVMAVWLHQSSTDVAPALFRVLRAVSEIAAVTAELHRILPLPGPLRVGAGINTGPAIIGGSDITALGDTVNAAFRLEAATKEIGLGVVLGEPSFAELKLPESGCFGQRQVMLKGYDGLTTVWAVSFEDLAEFLRGCAETETVRSG